MGVSADEAMRVLVTKMAHLNYSRLSSDERVSVRQAFFGLDKDDDGGISLHEFISANDAADDASGLVTKLFRYLDEDDNGYLDFGEYLTLCYFVAAGFRVCDACTSPVMILGFTCKTCWMLKSCDDSVDSFDLCAKCYGARTYTHQHEDLVDNINMYNMLFSNASAMTLSHVQCSICGDFHKIEIQGVLVPDENHVIKNEDSLTDFVCEWCYASLCSKCGSFFKGSPSTFLPHNWLKTRSFCTSCGELGSCTNLESIFEGIKQCKASELCSTCEIKIQKGLLWELYTNDKPTTSTSTTSEAEIQLQGLLTSLIAMKMESAMPSTFTMGRLG